MSDIVTHRFSTAGALRAPAAFAVLMFAATLAAPAAGHGPVRRKAVTEPPPGTAIPPGRPLDPKMLREPAGAPRSSAAVPTTGVLSIPQLAAESSAVVQGRTTRSEPFDQGRLRVYWLRVERTLRGHSDGAELAIVEMRGASERPPLLADGATVIALLRPAPSLSYLSEHLPAGNYFALTGGRDGSLPFASDAERMAIEHVLAEGARIAALPDDTERERARRALAVVELGSASPRLAADALVELRRVEPLQDLTPQELAALRATLTNRTIASATRIGLIQLLAERRVREAVPVITAAEVDDPAVLDAVLAARAKLGAPAGRAELAPHLKSKDAAVRASAVRALAALKDVSPGEVGRYAIDDPNAAVRVAAIDALGAMQRPSALPVLSQTFGTSEREVQQASGRAILAIGGGAAVDTLVNLALAGDSNETRTYAALLLLVTNGRDSEPVRRLMGSNPSPEVQHLVEHGLQWQHSHQHEE